MPRPLPIRFSSRGRLPFWPVRAGVSYRILPFLKKPADGFPHVVIFSHPFFKNIAVDAGYGLGLVDQGDTLVKIPADKVNSFEVPLVPFVNGFPEFPLCFLFRRFVNEFIVYSPELFGLFFDDSLKGFFPVFGRLNPFVLFPHLFPQHGDGQIVPVVEGGPVYLLSGVKGFHFFVGEIFKDFRPGNRASALKKG
jgi:hypothetical protein